MRTSINLQPLPSIGVFDLCAATSLSNEIQFNLRSCNLSLNVAFKCYLMQQLLFNVRWPVKCSCSSKLIVVHSSSLFFLTSMQCFCRLAYALLLFANSISILCLAAMSLRTTQYLNRQITVESMDSALTVHRLLQ